MSGEPPPAKVQRNTGPGDGDSFNDGVVHTVNAFKYLTDLLQSTNEKKKSLEKQNASLEKELRVAAIVLEGAMCPDNRRICSFVPDGEGAYSRHLVCARVYTVENR